MLALNNLISIIKVTAIKPTTNLQIVRWRKPRWIPKAKSKLYRIPERPVIPEEERIELLRLNNNYRNQMKSIRRYIVQKQDASLAITTDPKDIQRIFEEDFARCSRINDEWNSSIEVDRRQYFKNALEQDINSAKESLMKREELKRIQLEQAEKLVAEQKEAAKSFITADTIDEAIERALANPVDYNFAIDLDGNKHYNKNA